MIDGNFKKWSREWSNRDDTVKVERSGSIYKDKEDTEDLIIDIDVEEDDITETTITCDIDISERYNDYAKFKNENTVHDFVNNQIISYNRNGHAVKANVRNKILKIV